MNNSEEIYDEGTRIWSSYSFNHRAFVGSFDNPIHQTLSGKIGLFWDSYEFSSGWASQTTIRSLDFDSSDGPTECSVTGVNRHGRGVNIVYGDGRAGHLDMGPTRPGQFWNLVGWGSNDLNDPLTNINPSIGTGPFNSTLAPWKDI